MDALMKLVTVWFTDEERAFLDELAKTEDVTLSKALREGAQLYFEDAAKRLGAEEWLEARRGETGESSAQAARAPEAIPLEVSADDP
jgi:hypothetical protein